MLRPEVIFQLTGMTPLELAAEELFPALGIRGPVAWAPRHGGAGVAESAPAHSYYSSKEVQETC